MAEFRASCVTVRRRHGRPAPRQVVTAVGHCIEMTGRDGSVLVSALGEGSADLLVLVNHKVAWKGRLADLPQALEYTVDPDDVFDMPEPLEAAGGDDAEEALGEAENALWEAFLEGDEESFRDLVAQGADINAKRHGQTMVYETSEAGHFRELADLLALGADPNIPNRKGITPLMMAAHCGQTPCVALLLKHGARPDGVSQDDMSLEDLIAASNFVTDEIEAMLRDPQRVEAYELPGDFYPEWK